MKERLFVSVGILTLFAFMTCAALGVSVKFMPLVAAPFVLTVLAIVWWRAES